MAKLFGRTYTRADVQRYFGAPEQVAGVRPLELVDGASRGLRAFECYTGSGCRSEVVADRGMDSGAANHGGTPLAWISPVGHVHPAHYDPHDIGWLRSFGGGLMVGCGLAWYGAPTVDEGRELGLHGRLSNTPAMRVRAGAEWQGDEYVFWVEGVVREVEFLHEALQLTRRIESRMGADALRITDRVENIGHIPAQHMMLYHCNFGFPVTSPESELRIDSEVVPRDDEAAAGLAEYDRFGPPEPGYAEQVFFHTPAADSEGYARAALVNTALDFGAYVRYRAAELPLLVQWKNTRAGEYVCGLEPGTAKVTGRGTAREEGTLKVLEPGEIVEYAVEIGVLPDSAALDSYADGQERA